MEYFRDEKAQIYADIAYRMGKIVTQYEKLVVSEDKYEATLYLGVLQNLLTNCNEHVRKMTKGTRRNSVFKKSIESSDWGISEDCWVKNTFQEDHNLQNFITRMRNSVSHPTTTDMTSSFPSTGFSTIKDETDIIKMFRFINSPDTSRNKQKLFNSIEDIEKIIYRQNGGEDRIVYDEFPKDISFIEKEVGNKTKYSLVLNGEPFMRISIIDLSVEQLGKFVKELANYLAQPIQSNWDGINIADLLAA